MVWSGDGPMRVAVMVCLVSLLSASMPSMAGELGPLPQDDAGSGRDAPDTPTKEVAILPDTLYKGTGAGPYPDNQDHYHLTAEAGQTFAAWSDGNSGCFALLDATGMAIGSQCTYAHVHVNSQPLSVVLPYTGDYYLRISTLAPAVYTFVFSLSGDVPDIRLLRATLTQSPPPQGEPTPMPAGCNSDYTGGTFTDDCYHMRVNLNGLDTPNIDVLLVPPASIYPERDLRTMRQAIEMWDAGIHQLAVEMGMQWLADGVDFDIFVDDDRLRTDPLWDPEIVVVASNPVGGIGIGIDPLDFIFGIGGPCHGQPNPLAGFEDWLAIPGFDNHHDGRSGTYQQDCPGGGSICYAVNGAIDPAPGIFDFFGLYDLVAHEVGHCLSIGHVGDAGDHRAENVPFADIMSYTDQDHDKCVSTLDVEGFALRMSRYLLETPMEPNSVGDARGEFQVQHPSEHWYASSNGHASACPQPDTWIIP